MRGSVGTQSVGVVEKLGRGEERRGGSNLEFFDNLGTCETETYDAAFGGEKNGGLVGDSSRVIGFEDHGGKFRSIVGDYVSFVQ